MDKPIKITVYTTVYNTEPYVAQCVESVLHQTYRNFEYIILDNGCTDGSSEILREYARQDERIRLIRRDVNQYGYLTNIILTEGDGEYMTILDSDDWLEPRFLERLVSLVERHGLDIACAGSYADDESSGEERRYQKKLRRPAVIRPEQVPESFLQCLSYLNTLWGKIVRTDIFRKALCEPTPYATWALDTVACLRMLRMSNGMGIDDQALHHYRIRAGSVAATYNSTRFDGEVFFYGFVEELLQGYGELRQRDRKLLDEMYIGDVAETLQMASVLPAAERLGEYRRMLEHSLTQEVLRRQRETGTCIPAAEIGEGMLELLSSGEPDQDEVYRSARELLEAVVPRGSAAVTAKTIPLFVADRSRMRAKLGDGKLHQFHVEHLRMSMLAFGSRSPLRFVPGNGVPLAQYLMEDDAEGVLRRMKKLARKKDTAEQYGLQEAIRTLEQLLEGTER